jgi:hypothetical protein
MKNKKTPNPIPKHRRHGKKSTGKVKTAGRGKYAKSSNWKEVK